MVRKLRDVERIANNVIIRFQNEYYESVVMHNDIPATSKADTNMHGIGINSIKHAVGRYGGTVSIKADNKEKQFTV